MKMPAFHVQMVKNNKPVHTAETPACSHLAPKQINEIAQEQVKNVAVAIIGVYAAITFLNTASEIAINASPKR